jgi:hypothetical protein
MIQLVQTGSFGAKNPQSIKSAVKFKLIMCVGEGSWFGSRKAKEMQAMRYLYINN